MREDWTSLSNITVWYMMLLNESIESRMQEVLSPTPYTRRRIICVGQVFVQEVLDIVGLGNIAGSSYTE